MNILIQLSHPAHFHLYKNVARNLMDDGHHVFILIKTKDILEDLLKKSDLPYYNILKVAHRKSKFGVLLDMLVRDWRIMCFSLKNQVHLLTGSTPEVAQVGWLLHKNAVNCGEDDMPVVPAWEKVGGPFVDAYLCPDVCFNRKIEKKTVHYPSYHELAYLHSNHFAPDAAMVEQYGINPHAPYFIMRFSNLNAHHDNGIKGINTEIAQHLIDLLKPHGQIYITSERPLEPQFEQYRIKINPLDMHHVMAFASLYIGDSQTMAAEAGVLGVPFVRFNDFVGRIGYLRELEDVYHLGYGIRANTTPFTPEKVDWIKEEPKLQPCGAEAMYKVVEELMAMDATERKRIYQERRQRMLSEKIDYSKFLTWFIEHYPSSKDACINADDNFWKQFK